MSHEFQPFEKVLVRNSGDADWAIDFYGYDCGGYYRTTGGGAFSECIPYEGNEALLGTTNDVPPKCRLKFGDRVKVSDDMQTWYDGIFCRKMEPSGKRSGCYVAMTLNVIDNVTAEITNWVYCVPHEW